MFYQAKYLVQSKSSDDEHNFILPSGIYSLIKVYVTAGNTGTFLLWINKLFSLDARQGIKKSIINWNFLVLQSKNSGARLIITGLGLPSHNAHGGLVGPRLHAGESESKSDVSWLRYSYIGLVNLIKPGNLYSDLFNNNHTCKGDDDEIVINCERKTCHTFVDSVH